MAVKQKLSLFMREHLPLLFGFRVPGFLRIHWRYARYNFLTWFVLFIAPFVITVLSLRAVSNVIPDVNPSDLQLYLIAFFVIALMFFFAERHREFRKIYVLLIPVLVIAYGVLQFILDPGRFPGNLIRFGILTLLPAWWLWKRAQGKGYKALSDGAEKSYRRGADLYQDGQYEDAFVLLEPAAKRGHMKSLFLLGDSFEHGKGRPMNRVRAAQLYDRAGRKGYHRAQAAYEELFKTFSAEEQEQYEYELGASGINELF